MARSKRNERRLLATAFHEAGHAVAGHALEIPFRYVTIAPTEGVSLGHVQGFRMGKKLAESLGTYDVSPRQRDRVEREVMVFLAGSIAEARYTGRRNQWGASADYRLAVDLAERIAPIGAELDAFLAWLHKRTENLFARPHLWAAVEGLSAALMERGRLSRDETRQIIYETVLPAHLRISEI